ncbi:tandem-95 repeat protein, partial [Mycolicibacterium sp. P9-64]|uniref:beta strand repeat-containing protein n=1 Tax=Mycolicibacterium sp. P9-64 TaxID=2024612 RepID=UPI0011EF3D04
SGNLLTNDTDIDISTLTVVNPGTTTTDHGTVTLAADGSFTYTPTANYNGTDSFTYQATDGTTVSALATVTITITAVNDAPVATDDGVSTNEDTPSSGNVLTNDTDIDSGALTVVNPGTITTDHGTVTLAADGTFTYTPVANYNGTDSFTYQATDGTTVSDLATVTITVTAVNDAPVAGDDTATTNEDSSVSGNVLTNDTDIDSGTLTVANPGIITTMHGTVTLAADGSFTYNPAANFFGTDSFTYQATDGTNVSEMATVTITITAVNDAPAATDDGMTTTEDTPVSGNVVTNDTDIDSSTITVANPGTITTTHGTVTLASDGSFTFTPTANYFGTDSFTYQSTDGQAVSDLATVTITITAVNDAPAATDDTATTNEDTPVSGDVLTNDTDIDSSTLTVVSPGTITTTHGTVTLAADGSFTYKPVANYNGTDSFTYQVTDGTATSNLATVTITVTAVNDAPVATNDNFTTGEDGPLTVGAAAGVLGNDTDIDSSTLTVANPGTITTAHGTVTLAADGSFTYTPVANYNGTESFTYQATDGTNLSAPATVTITVTAVNDAPVATDDGVSTTEDNPVSGNVLTNDTDIDSSTLTVVSPGTITTDHGTVTLAADGSFTYTPAANYNGTDSFTYQVTDGTATSNLATVTITITAVNDPPVATDDGASTTEDTPVSGNVLTNDTDIDSSTLTVANPGTITTDHGTVTLAADGSFTYTPTANYNGTDSFTYQTTDGTTVSEMATVTITITAVNDAPVAGDDTATTNEDTPVSGNVLTNDTDIDSGTLTVANPGTITTDHGTVTLAADGSFTYTPTANYNGTDSFTYQATDGTALSAPATVTITITAVNDAPVAGDDTATTNEDNSVTGNVLTNDTDIDSGTLTVVNPGTITTDHGTVTLAADGSFTYTPASNYNGTDSFTYQATDGTTVSAPATVTITITAVNDAPVAGDDTVNTPEDTPLSGNVLTNDADIDSGPLTVANPGTITTTHGTVTLAADGSFTYTPVANYNGTDSFTYQATDGTTLSALATVTITITAVNDAPVATNDSFTTNEDTVLNGNVLTNDTDVDSGTLTAVLGTGPAHGNLTLNSDGSFTYTPQTNYNGADSFTYRTSDGTTASNLATVTIGLTAVNDPPTAGDNAYTVAEDGTLNVNAGSGVLTNDGDVDTDPLTAVIGTGPAHGSLALNADGSFTYTPTANYNGTDTFTYRASDGTATSNLATVTITITAVNDAPVAGDDTATTTEDAPVSGNVLTNDTDIDGGTLTVATPGTITTAHGSVALNADGTFTYTPTANYNGTDSFTYRTTDGTATSNLATVTITITAVNDAPVATNDSYNLGANGSVTVPATGVLANDTDVESSPLTAVLVTGPAHGTLNLNADGSFTYTATSAYSGSDSFTYMASDGTTTGNIATVTITDTIKPTAVDVQTTNAGGAGGVGVIQQNDTITYTFSEPMDPSSIIAGWDGTGTRDVVVRVNDGDLLLGIGAPDTLQVYDATNSAVLPLGTVSLGRTDYANSLLGGLLGSNLRYGATGTASKMTMSADKRTITIVLGTYSASNLLVGQGTAGGNSTMVWTPTAGPKDLAGNPLATPIATATESGGTADKEF